MMEIYRRIRPDGSARKGILDRHSFDCFNRAVSLLGARLKVIRAGVRDGIVRANERRTADNRSADRTPLAPRLAKQIKPSPNLFILLDEWIAMPGR